MVSVQCDFLCIQAVLYKDFQGYRYRNDFSRKMFHTLLKNLSLGLEIID